jgi:hypothetical protein
MPIYCLAGQRFRFSRPIAELKPFETDNGAADEAASFVSYSFPGNESSGLVARTRGWVGGAQRMVEVYAAPRGFLLKVEDGGEFFIAPHGEAISKSGWQHIAQAPAPDISKLDREIILGPALVLALALRDVWSLHASAAIYKENVIVFLGESGQGKSTLAGYLSQSAGWRLAADDLLPVIMDANGISALPRFPQLKLPIDSQPGAGLPERLPLKNVCVLMYAEPDQMPELQKIPTAQTVQSLLTHIAGARMFNTSLLAKHLEFSTQAAKQISAYRLIHPHRLEALPLVREFLENLC